MSHLLFEITPEDIQALNDSDARNLIAKLCEAEIRSNGGSSVGLIAGGAQTAPDAGSDVRVSAAPAQFRPGFVPCAKTVLQVKAEAMPKARITAEMRPKGVLRPIIQELAGESGAYVIASARDNLPDASILTRRKAMLDALGTEAPGLHVDFYDASRLALWLQQHPGVVLWVKERLGRNTSGWAPFGAWSASDRLVEEDYIIDEKSRLRRDGAADTLSVVDGLQALRAELGERAAVRLVGLSGHGKTRFAQALFEERVGTGALGEGVAVYGDVGRGVDPTPRALAEQLVALGRRAVLVVDNCPGSIHRSLVEVVRQPGSRLSVLTVEYDVGEDDFENTAEFRLEPASNEMVSALLKQRGFDLSQTDRDTVATFAQGNTRMALALARSAPKRGSLSALNDAELLERLFGRNPNQNQRAAADAASLVVSFDFQAGGGDTAEAPILADLAGLSSDEFHSAIVELLRGDLVQQRGPWRAVLPQALADRLSRVHLQKLRPERIWDTLVVRAPARLRSSFCHRLGRLHDVPIAVEIAKKLLADSGPLGALAELSDVGVKAFEFLAPAAPEAALAAIERALAGADASAVLSTEHPHRALFSRTARSIAYEPELFERAIHVVARFNEAEPEDFRHESSREMFEALFRVVLSGTVAPPTVRFGVVRRWIASGDLVLAKRAIEAGLQASFFSSVHNHDFGARQRTFGWEPRGDADVLAWFEDALARLMELAQKDRKAAAQVLGHRFRELWNVLVLRPTLLKCARAMGEDGFEQALWFEVCETLHYGRDEPVDPDIQELEQLEVDLRPNGIDELFRAHVLSAGGDWYDPEGGDLMDSMQTSAAKARAMGPVAVSEPALLDRHELDLFQQSRDQTFTFGSGYAAAIPDLDAGWQDLCERLGRIGSEATNVSVLAGYLVEARKRDQALTESWLDAAVHDAALGKWFVTLQATAGIDDAALVRLETALDVEQAPLWTYRTLAGGRAMDHTPPAQLRSLLIKLAGKPDGSSHAVDILGMRLHSEKERQGPLNPAVADIGRELLRTAKFERTQETMYVHHLGEVADLCLWGEDNTPLALQIAERLRDSILHRDVSAHTFHGVAAALFKHQLTVALDTFVADEKTWWAMDSLVRGFERDPGESGPVERSPIASADPDACMAWVEVSPEARMSRLADAIPYVEKSGDGFRWTPFARRLLDGVHGVIALQTFVERFPPAVFWGSMLDQLLRRKPLLEALLTHENPALGAEAQRHLEWLQEQAERASDLDRDPGEQTFE